VDEKAGIGVRHSYAPPGLWIQASTLIPQAYAVGLPSFARYAGGVRREAGKTGIRFQGSGIEDHPTLAEPG
jgi:hypothetical protein